MQAEKRGENKKRSLRGTAFIIETELLLSGKTFLGLSVLVKIDLNLLFLRIIGYYRSFLVKISAFYDAYSLKLKKIGRAHV